MVKLDLLLGIVVVCVGSFFIFRENLWERILLGVLYFLTFFWAMLGLYAVRLESKRLMLLFFIFSVIQPTHTAYKVLDVATENIDTETRRRIEWGFFALGGFSVVVRVQLVVQGVRAMRNFGRGLRRRILFNTRRSGRSSHRSPMFRSSPRRSTAQARQSLFKTQEIECPEISTSENQSENLSARLLPEVDLVAYYKPLCLIS